jgi:hypothetical protein
MTLSKAKQAEIEAAKKAAGEENTPGENQASANSKTESGDKGPEDQESEYDKAARELKEKEDQDAIDKAAEEEKKRLEEEELAAIEKAKRDARKKPSPPPLSIREEMAKKNALVVEGLEVMIEILHDAQQFAEKNQRPFRHIFSTKQQVSGLLQQYKANSK